MTIDFRSDPIGQRFKGWKQPPNSPKTRLVPGWEPRPEFGAGQSGDDYMALIEPPGMPPVITPLVPADREDRLEPYDWGRIREKVFPGGLEPTPSAPMVPADREERIPRPSPTVPADREERISPARPARPAEPERPTRGEPDPDLTARLGGRPVARKAPDVYDPSQARTLSSSAPTPARPPGGPPTAATSAQAAGGPGGAGPRTKSQQDFVETLLPKAQAMGRKLGIPWQVLMAIPANETGWGQSVFHNNYFGIKGPGAKARTWEVIGGKRVDITDSFRTFDSPESSMQGFAELMQNQRYSKALDQLRDDPSNWPAFVSMIHSAGYATDPTWAQKVIRIGQGLENAASQPLDSMSKVTPSGGLLDTARSATQPSGGVMKPGEGGVIPVVPGGRKDSYWTAGGTHTGGPAADIFAEKGSPIHAPVGGTSQPATYSKGGNATTIKGDDGRYYYLAHGNVPFVGGRIEAGQQIGQVGDTGNAKGTNPHLHFAIASDPGIFNKRDGSGDIWGGAEYWGAGGGKASVAAGQPYTDSGSYVAWAYRNGLGRNVPARASGLYAASKPISAAQAVPGDLVMFNMSSRDPNEQHVGIYAGNGKMLHNLDGVEETDLWKGAEFRRLSGVRPEDLMRMGTPGTSGTPARSVQPQSVNRIVKYVDNEDGTYTATHQDGTTTIERSVTQPAPVEGGPHPSYYKTSTIRPEHMGGGQEEDIEDTTDYPYTPRAAWATDDLPRDPLDPMSDPERRAQALRDRGWTEDAIARVRDVPTNVWGARNKSMPEVGGTYTPGSVGEQLASTGESAPAPTNPQPPGRIDIYAPTVSEYGNQMKAGTGETYTPENVYQHEAHHAIDELTPGVRRRLQPQGISNAADVIEDLNMVRSFAAVHSDRELFESVNEALWAWRNDPAHINHYMGLLGTLRGTPEWYRERYFGHRAASPDWQGAEPESGQLSMTDTRTLGQEPPPPKPPEPGAPLPRSTRENLQPEPSYEEMLKRSGKWIEDEEYVPAPEMDKSYHMGAGYEDPNLDTYYHGTTAEYGKVDPNEIAGLNLYGPGYYLTDSPRVAGGTVESGRPDDPEYNPTFSPGYVYKRGYSHKGFNTERLDQLQRQLEQDENLIQHIKTMDPREFDQWGTTLDKELDQAVHNRDFTQQQLGDLVTTQPNVRQVGLPRDLSFWDLDQPMDDKAAKVLSKVTGYPPEEFTGMGTDVYKFAVETLVDENGWEYWEAQDTVSAAMEEAGYDGIAHVGGGRTRGEPHNVRILFPERVSKVKNLFSGEYGGSSEVDPSLTPKATDQGTDWTPIEPTNPPANQGEIEATKPTDEGVDFAPKLPVPEPANKGERPKTPPLINVKPGPLPGMPGLPGISFMGAGQEFTDGGGGGGGFGGGFLNPATGEWESLQSAPPPAPVIPPLSQSSEETYEQRRAREDAEWEMRWGAYQREQEGKAPFILGGVGDAFSALGTATQGTLQRAGEVTQPDRDVIGQAASAVGGALSGVVQPVTERMAAPAQLEPGQQPAREQIGEAASALGEAVTPQAGALPASTGGPPSRFSPGGAPPAAAPTPPPPSRFTPPTAPTTEPDPSSPAAQSAQVAGEALTAYGELTGGPSAKYPSGGPAAGPITGSLREQAGIKQETIEFERQTGVSYADFEKIVAAEGAAISAGTLDAFSPGTLELAERWNALGGHAGVMAAYSRMAPEEQEALAERPGAIATAAVSTLLVPGSIAKTPMGLIRAAAAMTVSPGDIPVVGGFSAVGGAAKATAKGSPLLRNLANSPVGKFLVEEDGGGPVSTEALKIVRNVAVGGGIAGTVGVIPDLANPRLDDPEWWSEVISDFSAGAKVGGLVGLGLTGGSVLAKGMSLDKTVTPAVLHAYRGIMDPIRNLTPWVQEAAGTRTAGMYRAMLEAEIVKRSGFKLFGESGQGFNTWEAAAYVEKNETLAGFVGRGGEKPNQEQIDWVADRVRYERQAGMDMRAANVLAATQDVETPLGQPGPTVHVMHLFEKDVAVARKAEASQAPQGGLSWRDTQTHGRAKTTDPNIDQNIPRTIDESHAEWVRDPDLNKKPLDSLVDRFEASAFQTEKVMANHAFWEKIKPLQGNVENMVTHKDGPVPDGWVKASEGWHFGQGGDQFKYHPDLASYLDNVANTGKAQTQPWLEYWGRFMAMPQKTLLFAAAPIHLFNMAYRVASVSSPNQTAEVFRSWLLPSLFRGGYGNQLLAKPDVARRAIDAGMTIGRGAAEGLVPQFSLGKQTTQAVVGGGTGFAFGWQQAKARGENDDEAFRQGFVGSLIGLGPSIPGSAGVFKVLNKNIPLPYAASIADIIHHGIFYEALPSMKLGMFEVLTKAGGEERLIAELVNNTVGGVDVLKTGRAPWMHDLLRYGLIASDWTEGQVRTLASLGLPTAQGALTRRQIIKGLAIYMGGVEYLNWRFNGHPTWENGHGKEYQLEITGLLDKLAELKGDPGLRSVDNEGKPMRTYVDPMPPMRWAMEYLGEWGRLTALTQGQIEHKLGETGAKAFGVPLGDVAAGQRLIERASGDLTKGEIPPDPRKKTLEFGLHRLGPGLSSLGAWLELARGEQFDWTGKPLAQPIPEVPSSDWTRVAHAFAPQAPTFSQAFTQNVDIAHPQRTRGVDAFVEMLGLTRATATKDISANLQAADQLKRHLGVNPWEQFNIEQSHIADIVLNEDRRKKLFASLQDSALGKTHAQFDDEYHKLINQRQGMTNRDVILKNYVSKAPEWAKPGIQDFLESVWIGKGSELPADPLEDIDVGPVTEAYWAPPGANPADEVGFRKAQRNVLSDMAYANDMDPEVLEDQIKWRAQHLDLASGAVPPFKLLPGMTSGTLSEIASGFLRAAELRDSKGQLVPGELIPDVDKRADAQRAYLKEQAIANGVEFDTLLERVNLRLARPEQITPIERSYNRAVQTFFTSKDDEEYPRYRNLDGSPQGTREMWDLNDKKIAAIGQGKAKRMPEWRELVLAKERGENAREKFLNASPYNTDFERWYGIGRSMTERQWTDYRAGRLVGYKDLDRFPNAPKDETARRDKIQKKYRASDDMERRTTPVEVFVGNRYVTMPLISASRYIRHFHVNSAGRSLRDLAAYDELDPDTAPSLGGSTVAGDEEEE